MQMMVSLCIRICCEQRYHIAITNKKLICYGNRNQGTKQINGEFVMGENVMHCV